MSDRHRGYIVTLKENLKDEDSRRLMDAIACLSGVIDVRPAVEDYGTLMADVRARKSLLEKVLRLLKEEINEERR